MKYHCYYRLNYWNTIGAELDNREKKRCVSFKMCSNSKESYYDSFTISTHSPTSSALYPGNSPIWGFDHNALMQVIFCGDRIGASVYETLIF